MFKKVFVGMVLVAGVSSSYAAEDFYPLYLKSPTKCAVEHGDQAAKVVLEQFDRWYYEDKLRESARVEAFRDASQAARFLKDSNCKDPLMLFRWATMARMQDSEALQQEAWDTILTVLGGLEEHYPPVLDNAYNTLAKMADDFDPSQKEHFYKMAIETARQQEKYSPMINLAYHYMREERYSDARKQVDLVKTFGEERGINRYALKAITSVDDELKGMGL
jgi:hypothetical protein